MTLLALICAVAPAQGAFNRTPIDLGPSDGGSPSVVMDPPGTAHAVWGVAEDVMQYCAIPRGSRGCALPPVALQLDAFGTFALVETIIFVVLLLVAFVFVWRRGALEWK